MSQAECRRSRLYSSIQAATLARAWALVAKCSRARSSKVSVECHASITALSKAGPGRPMDCLMPIRPQAARKVCAVYSPGSLVGMQDHPGDVAAADCDRHRQGCVGQRRVVVLAEREPRHPV